MRFQTRKWWGLNKLYYIKPPRNLDINKTVTLCELALNSTKTLSRNNPIDSSFFLPNVSHRKPHRKALEIIPECINNYKKPIIWLL